MDSTNPLREQLAARFADRPLRIGTRQTPLALAQTARVVGAIAALAPTVPVELEKIVTEGDLWHGALEEIGGKGAYTRTIDTELCGGGIDIAVHSLKDVPGDVPLPAGTVFGAYLERGDVHDVAITRDGRPIADLPRGAKVGTSSVRRRAQINLWRPDLQVERVRGAVGTRLEHLREGRHDHDAIVLARTGLQRLGLGETPMEEVPIAYRGKDELVIVPAVGAAVIVVQARQTDAPVMALLEQINHSATSALATAERVALHALRGHCNSPIAAHAYQMPDRTYALVGIVFRRDGSQWVRTQKWHKDPAALGAAVAGDLIEKGAMDLINATRK